MRQIRCQKQDKTFHRFSNPVIPEPDVSIYKFTTKTTDKHSLNQTAIAVNSPLSDFQFGTAPEI